MLQVELASVLEIHKLLCCQLFATLVCSMHMVVLLMQLLNQMLLLVVVLLLERVILLWWVFLLMSLIVVAVIVVVVVVVVVVIVVVNIAAASAINIGVVGGFCFALSLLFALVSCVELLCEIGIPSSE